MSSEFTTKLIFYVNDKASKMVIHPLIYMEQSGKVGNIGNIGNIE